MKEEGKLLNLTCLCELRQRAFLNRVEIDGNEVFGCIDSRVFEYTNIAQSKILINKKDCIMEQDLYW